MTKFLKINLFTLLNKMIIFVFSGIILSLLFIVSYFFVRPLYYDGPYHKLSVFMILLNILSVIMTVYLLSFRKKFIKYPLIILIGIFITFEVSSLYFLGKDINTTFLINVLDINFINTGIKLRPFLSVLAVILFVLLIVILFLVSKLPSIKNKVIRFSVLILPIFYLLSPFGFFYRVGYYCDTLYVKDIFKYGRYSYNEIYKIMTNNDYTIRENLVSNTNKKNIVIIYLESFEQEYLYNSYLSKYTEYLKQLSMENEFHFNLKQLDHADYTTAGIFTTMCGLPLNLYVTNNGILRKRYNNKLVCIPNILKKSGYKQVYIGGAIGKLFYKKDLFNMFEFDEFYEKSSILETYNSKLKLSNWGIYDKDMFDFAKKKYIELSKANQPFNLTLLTLATHNTDGVHDDRCKNSDKIGLANAIECTNDLLEDFIKFLKKQSNFKNTLVIILPDHIQYHENTLKEFINEKNKRLLYIILLNSNNKKLFNNDIVYTDLPAIIIDNLDIKTNAKFLYNDMTIDTNSKIKLMKKFDGMTKMFLNKVI